MKRILSIAIIAIMALANVAHAEENKGGNVEFEITGGVQAATISYGTIVSRVGFHAGLRASKDFKFFTPENAIYGNVAALISLKGGKLENDEGKTVYNPYYLEIPIHAGYSTSSATTPSSTSKWVHTLQWGFSVRPTTRPCSTTSTSVASTSVWACVRALTSTSTSLWAWATMWA